MTWYDIDPFVDNTIRRIDTWQQIWANIEHLQHPMYADNPMTAGGSTWSTTGTAFTDIDTTRYRLEFETSGNDLMVTIPLKHHFTVVSSGATAFRLELDGTAYGNTLGLARIQNFDTQVEEVQHLMYIIEDLPAGDHTLDVQYGRVSSGTANVIEEACLIPWVNEY